MGLNNVAEGILDIAIRRGVDPRDFSLVAFGAAGPMLLPALLELIPLRRVDRAAPPWSVQRPGPGELGSGLLRPPQLLHPAQRGAAPAIDGLFNAMEEGLWLGPGPMPARCTSCAPSTAVWSGRAGRRPLSMCPRARSRPMPSGDGAVVPRHLRAAKRQPVPGLPGPGRHLAGATGGADPEGRLYEQVPAGNGQSPSATGSIVMHHLSGDDVEATEIDRSGLAPGRSRRGPAVVREAMSTTFVPPGRVLTAGAYGELVIE